MFLGVTFLIDLAKTAWSQNSILYAVFLFAL